MPESQAERMLGKYRLDVRLGEGGMGVVYAAFDTLLKRRVAIKLLPESTAADPVALQRFVLEAQAAARLNHPNAVAVYEVARRGGTHFIAMELVEGVNVAERLNANGPFPYREATRIAADVCRALVAAHAAGLIHRDVKPANFMLAADGRVKLADFGLSKAVDRRGQSLTGAAVCGTPAFMSPEQCRSDEVDSSSDIYSLGASYFALLAGRPPFEAEQAVQVMFAHCTNPAPDPRQVNPAVPVACARIVQKAMAKNAADRFFSASAMLEALEEVLSGNGPTPPPVSPPLANSIAAGPRALQSSASAAHATTQVQLAIRERSPRRRQRVRRSNAPWFLGGVATVILGAAVLLGFLLSRPTPKGEAIAANAASARPAASPRVGPDRASISKIASPANAEVNLPQVVPEKPEEQAVFDNGISPASETIQLNFPVSALAFTPDNQHLIAGELGDNGRLVEIEIKSHRLTQTLDLATLGHNVGLRGNGTQHGILAVSISPDGKQLVVGGSGLSFGTWIFDRDGQQRWRLDKKLTPASASSLTFTEDGEVFAASLTLVPPDFPSLRLWDSLFLSFVDPLENVQPRVREVVFLPGEHRVLLAADESGRVTRYAMNNPPARVVQKWESGLAIEAIAVSPDGRNLAVIGQGRMQMWRMDRTDRFQWEVAAAAHDVIFTLDSQNLITAGGRLSEREIGIWQVAGLQLQRTLTGHQQRVQHVALTKQGDVLASGSIDRTVRLWRLKP